MTHLPVVVQVENKPIKVISMEFKEWVEQTHLFFIIKTRSGNGVTLDLINEGIQLELTSIVTVEKAEDLPIELLQEFWRHSPFFAQEVTKSIEINKQNNNNYESRDSEALW